MTYLGPSPLEWQEMHAWPGFMDAEPLLPRVQVVLLVHVGEALSGSGGSVPASPLHAPEG
jgi:hypothetical protein